MSFGTSTQACLRLSYFTAGLAVLLFAAILVSCGKKSETLEGTSTPTAAPAASPAVTPTAPAADPSATANLSELTQTVRKFAAEQRRVPKNLEEVVSAGYLPSMPSAPAGKKLAIDKNLQVYFADP